VGLFLTVTGKRIAYGMADYRALDGCSPITTMTYYLRDA
jgi:hypothetical protein